MKNLITGLMVVTVLLIAFLAVLTIQAQEAAVMSWFTVRITENKSLLFDFYYFEDYEDDQSSYLGTLAIKYNCTAKEYEVDEIVDIPVNGYREHSQDQIFVGIENFAYEILVLLNVEFNWENVFPEGMPQSFQFQENRQTLRSYNSLEQSCFTTFLPLITK